MAAARADRSDGNYTVFQSGVYTACEPCKDDPKKPPLWQVKAARIIHNQTEKMIYFEDAKHRILRHAARLFPLSLDARSDREAQERLPDADLSRRNTVYGFGVETPYYLALAPDYDLTLSPRITTQQGPLMQSEWRHRLENGYYRSAAPASISSTRMYFLRDDGTPTPGYREIRGSLERSGRFISRRTGAGVGTRLVVSRSDLLPGLSSIQTLQQRTADPLGTSLTR